MPRDSGVDLLRRHDAIGEIEQHHREAVVVRRMHADVIGAGDGGTALRRFEIAEHLAGGQVVHRAREIAVPAKRHHERDAIADRFAAGRDDREAAGKADADHADLAVGAELRLFAGPLHRVFDDVGDLRRDLELLQIWRGDRQHAVAGGREILGETDQARFVDAVAMHAGNQHHACAAVCRAGR